MKIILTMSFLPDIPTKISPFLPAGKKGPSVSATGFAKIWTKSHNRYCPGKKQYHLD